MKLIRMKKMMAGPAGTRPPGLQLTVSDVEAAMLVEAEAAEVIAEIADEATSINPVTETADIDPTDETAAVDPVTETATPAKAKKSK